MRLHHINAVALRGDRERNERFEHLRDPCDVVLLPRIPVISTTRIKDDFGMGAEGEA